MPKLELDEELVRKLSGLLDETGLTEIEYEGGGHRIRVVRGGTVLAAAPAPAAPPQVAAPAPADGAPADAVPANAVTSPMVGTAYCAPEPGAPAFVSVGDTVKEGQTLLIIEAMKVMNQIPSPKAGKVSQILVQDGQPVEYGEPLLIIE
ncbi:MAG: acetyl-CoA carboxylase biotin carboxyl carrier protein [Rhodospirillales bacterium]|nr:acetyl-CoA carboxylase biotin carboxyl carrier protein [Rhodospirillales bacterium]MDH3912554.1 acetyl-CoA carboxylase biotin carboxyl carrier protein [Rhodospirillales bacterium]MDH3919891.1 acetyl-CoA carboxylase biotin carboxyl carrier protein [Rhodospirillales bacterium]MDH3968047.1 acetyl-CoA carboxylase biotin carboxyl carrier protein [Rhodospirillales bacterium]